MNIGTAIYQLAYQKSPIFLVDGIAASLPGHIMPIIAITQSANFNSGLLSGNISLNTDSFYANFEPIQGATLHNNQIAKYPFANQQTAANSIISQPLNVSMKMITPLNTTGAMVAQIMTSTALKNALENHNLRGGTYTVLTPSFLYQGCIMTGFKDISSGESKKKQMEWQIDFEQPLLSEKQAVLIEGALFQKLTGGVKTGISWSGIPGL